MERRSDLEALAQVYQGGRGLSEYRAAVLKLLAVAILGLTYVVAWLSAAEIALAPGRSLFVITGLLATASLTYAGLRLSATASAAFLIVGLTAVLTGALVLYPDRAGHFAVYYCLITLAASSALGTQAGVGVAFLLTGVLLGVEHATPIALPRSDLWPALVLVWSALLLSWVSTQPLRMVASWAWASYMLAQSKTEEARLRQAELASLSRSLAEACDRLERLNQDLYEAREEAEAARRMKAEFAATVGHELRTPINLIIGFTQMMVSPRRASYYDEPLPASYRGDIEAIHRNACHVSNLVDDILDLSQVDAHRMALHREPILLAEVVREATASVAALYADAGLDIRLEIPDDLPAIPADPVRIRQVLINLLYNSVRFTHRGGVTIGAHVGAAEVIVSVSDTGIGIPPGEIPRLFEQFRQPQAPTRGRVGSGFGLAVCKRFIELHGGSIWAESVVGQGTTIHFSLPLHENVVTAPHRRLLRPVAPLAQVCVAVLDPIGHGVRILQRYLDAYHVEWLTSASQIAGVVAAGRVRALIVTNAAARQEWNDWVAAHADLRDLPTLFCPLRTREIIAYNLGVAAYLVKPVTTKDLMAALGRLEPAPSHVVVVEDDDEMRGLLARTLRFEFGSCSVAEAADGADGLALIRETRPDAVLLDLLLPEMDGYQVIRAMRQDEALARIPVIVISAKGLDEGVVASTVEVSRPRGLSVRDAMACLKADLDALTQPHSELDGVQAALR